MNLKDLVGKLAEIESGRFQLEKDCDFGIRYRILTPFSNQIVFNKVFDYPTDAKHKDLKISSRFEDYLLVGSLLDWIQEVSLSVEVSHFENRVEVTLKKVFGLDKSSWSGKGETLSTALIEAWVKYKESAVVIPEIREIQIA